MNAGAAPVIVQVLPPGEGGVADYQRCLQACWAEQGVESHVLPFSRQAAREQPLAERIEALAGAAPCTVVLHFSGYGYSARGLCFWLLDELRALRTQRVGRLRLVPVFHELFASGPPWRSAFWLSQLQARIALRLARQADALWTNTEQHAQWLRGATHDRTTVHTWPVFSNVGEPAAESPLAARASRVVVFGSPATRQRAIDGLRGCNDALLRLGITELVEVGGGGASIGLPRALACHHAGRLAPAALRVLLQGARFGLLDYPPPFLGKSGVFAAYAAHGCVVLNTSPAAPDTDGLAAGRHYVSLTAPPADTTLPAHEARAIQLTQWYAAHRLAHQASRLLAVARAG